VPYPPPFSPFQFFLNWWLVGLLPLLKVSYTNSKFSLTTFSGASSTSDGLSRFLRKSSGKRPTSHQLKLGVCVGDL
jgi:hypothetical protein